MASIEGSCNERERLEKHQTAGRLHKKFIPTLVRGMTCACYERLTCNMVERKASETLEQWQQWLEDRE